MARRSPLPPSTTTSVLRRTGATTEAEITPPVMPPRLVQLNFKGAYTMQKPVAPTDTNPGKWGITDLTARNWNGNGWVILGGQRPQPGQV
jgi:hypothetical protein